jgi:gliding motility-associated-like protein
MSKDPIDIDNLFKKAFENAPMTPPPGAFFAIKSQLPSLAATAGIGAKVAISIKMFGVIASTLIIAGTAVYYLMGTGSESPIASHANESSVLPNLEKSSKSTIPKLSGEAQPNAGGLNPLNTTVGSNNPEVLNKIEDRTTSLSRNAMGNRGNVMDKSNQGASTAAGNQSTIANWPRAASALSDGMEIFTPTPMQPAANSPIGVVSKASQEKKNGAVLNTNGFNCKSRFEINLSEPVQGAHELAFKVQGEFGRYDWGLGKQILGTWTAREGHVNRPIYVKKSQELHFWVRAHFLDGCKDTQSFVRWVSPKNYELPEVFPSIFTPNNDGYNDSFYVTMSEPEFFEITVMDMRGNRVFTSKNLHEKWSGMVGDRACPNGIYQVQLTRRYSHEINSEKRNFKLELR